MAYTNPGVVGAPSFPPFSVPDLLADLGLKGASVHVNGSAVNVVNAGHLSAADLARITSNKAAILAHVASATTVA